MASFVRTVSAWFCRTATLACVAVAACTPVAEGNPGGADASVIYVERGRDDAGNVVTALLHVAGLAGSGLVLSLDGEQEIAVPSSGIWHVPLTKPVQDVTLRVLVQPDSPAQTCDFDELDEGVFSVICQDDLWKIGGVIKGLEGKGLQIALFDEGDDDDVLEGGAHSIFVATRAGDFSFSRPLEDNVTYRLEILHQPVEPRQTCTITNGEGLAEADISNIEIECVTKTWFFRISTIGLKGTGLTMDSEAGPFLVDPGVNAYEDLQYPDGYVYFTHVLQQPSNPAQTCFVEGGDGVIDGANVDIMVICDAPAALKIAEVGACPFSNSSCWFEVVNTGAVAENLAYYRFRTSALSDTSFVPSRVFNLPPVTIPPFGRVMVHGKVAGSMPDGKGVIHVADANVVPWWSSDGFVELLSQSGATASFIRWGSSTMAPTTGGTYGGGSAPALPRGAAGFGYSIQHPNGPGKNPPTGDEFALLTAPTYGGPNDAPFDTDADNDGIPDSAEVPGGSYAGMSMYAMGARINQKDIFVEIDHMAGGDPATLPRKEALDKIVDVFKNRFIFVHFDVGNLFSPIFDPANYNLGGGNEVPFATTIGLGSTDPAVKSLYDIKAENMDANRRMIFYYQVFAWSQQKDGSGGSSGVGEMPGNDSIISLGGFGLTLNSSAQRNLVASYQAASVMHELGHNFGLRHGGGDSINRKPNYVSVMNYLYSPLGLPTIGNAEGDRFDFYKRCSLSSVTQLTNAPSGDLSKFVINYSSGGGENIDENAVREREGLGRTGSKAVDFNCNGQSEGTSYARDLNSDGALDVLSDNDDWSALDFVFRRSVAGNDNGPSLRPELERFDTLTADSEHATDAPCPAPMVPDMDELR